MTKANTTQSGPGNRQSAKSNPAKPKPPAWRICADRLAIIACYLLAAACFDQLDVSIVIGLIGTALYFCIYKRNPKAIALVISIVISFALFHWVGGRIVRSMVGRSYALDVDHRMRPNNAIMQSNSDSIRCQQEADAFKSDDYNIIFCGDSFVYGLGIKKTQDVFPYIVQRLLNGRPGMPHVHCVDFGWTSSSPLLSLRLLKDIGAKYKPDLVVLSIDMTDFHDDLRYRHGQQYVGLSALEYLAFRLDATDVLVDLRKRFLGTELLDAISSSNVIIPMDRYFEVNQPLSESAPFMEETAQHIDEFAAYCKDTLHCKFMAVMHPRGFQYSDKESPNNWEAAFYKNKGPYVLEPFKWMQTLDARTPYPCLSILEAFRQSKVYPLYQKDDPHWNEAGQRVAAQAMVELILKEKFLP